MFGVDEQGDAEAMQVASALGLGYEAAAMALLRAYRGGLVARTGAPGSEPFRYTLTDKGEERLDYLRAAERVTADFCSLLGNPASRAPRLQSSFALLRVSAMYAHA